MNRISVSHAARQVTFAVTLAFLSCAHTSPTVISAATIDGFGVTFVEAGDLFNRGLKSGAISPAQYKVWAEFAPRFKASYGLAVDLWHASSGVEDAPTNAKISALLAGLGRELTDLLADAQAAWRAFEIANPPGPTSPDGGKLP